MKLTIFALILASLLSSCVSYSNPDFGGFREVEITELVKSEVAIEKNHTASSQNKPILGKFTFRFRIIDPKGAFSSITVTRMTAQYKNGDVQTMTKPWTKTFAESRKRRGADSPMHLNVETLLFRHENVTVRFDGFLTTAEGERVSFSMSERFRAGSDSGVICLLLNPWALT